MRRGQVPKRAPARTAKGPGDLGDSVDASIVHTHRDVVSIAAGRGILTGRDRTVHGERDVGGAAADSRGSLGASAGAISPDLGVGGVDIEVVVECEGAGHEGARQVVAARAG